MGSLGHQSSNAQISVHQVLTYMNDQNPGKTTFVLKIQEGYDPKHLEASGL
jgi:hypothetical protein